MEQTNIYPEEMSVEETPVELEITEDVQKLIARDEKSDETNSPESSTDANQDVSYTNTKEILDAKAELNDTVAIIDVEIGALRRKRIRINGDNHKIIELDTSDVNVANRLSKSYKKLTKLMDEAYKFFTSIPDDAEAGSPELDDAMNNLSVIDEKMRNEVDYIFDYPVSDIVLEGTSMWSPKNGMFAFEHIIENLIGLFDTGLTNEFRKMRQRVNSEAKAHKATVSKFHQ